MAATREFSQVFASQVYVGSRNVHLHIKQFCRLCHIPVKQSTASHISPTKMNLPRAQFQNHLPRSVRKNALLSNNFRPTCIDSLQIASRSYSVLPQRAIYTTPFCMFEEEAKETRSCWKCGKTTDVAKDPFFCKCGVVQSPGKMTYFKLLGIKEVFQVDLKKLNEAFIDLQKRLHPDMFSTKSETEKALAEQQSALLNKAYYTLLKPLPRALYLLEIKGYVIEEGETHSQMDQEFLMEILDLNERIGECNAEAIAEIEKEIVEKIHENVSLVSAAFNAHDFEKAKEIAVRLNYYVNVESKVKAFHRERM